MSVSRYLESAIKDELKYHIGKLGLSRAKTMYVDVVDALGCIRNIHVLVKHKALSDGSNCSIFSILSYPDWYISSADLIGHAILDGNGIRYVGEDYGDYTKDRISAWLDKALEEWNQ
jgi:hypothetical protein